MPAPSPAPERTSLRQQVLLGMTLTGLGCAALTALTLATLVMAFHPDHAALRGWALLLGVLTLILWGVAVQWVLHTRVFHRMDHLRAFVEQVETTPYTPARLSTTAWNDELSSAARALNRLLDRLNRDHEQQRAQSVVLRLIAENKTVQDVLTVIQTVVRSRYPLAQAELLPAGTTNPAPTDARSWSVAVRGRGGERYGHLLLRFAEALPEDITSEAAWMADLLGVAAEQQRLRTELSLQAFNDDLTGLLNRRGMVQALTQQLAHGPHQDAPLVLLHLDIDRFKHANDLLGHAAGDDLLRVVAARLTALQGQPGADVQVARLGGDEFVLSVFPAPGGEHLDRYAAQLGCALSEPAVLQGQPFPFTVSVGYTQAPRDAADAETLLRFAALATEHVKRSGAAHATAFRPEMQDALVDRLQLEHDLRDALAQDALDLAFQPQVSLTDTRVVGFEALLRWNHPTRGPVPPASFVPIAEDAGMISELGYWVLRRAALQATVWRAQGITAPIAVNLSAAQLLDTQIVNRVQALLTEFQLPPEGLTLEVTESLLMSGEPGSAAHGQLRALAALGLNIALDDFGTGYSSLSYLHRLPITTVKVDRSFVKDLPESLEAARIVETIIRLGQQLNLQVFAEGVERPEQADLLARLGCHGAQGYLYARPMPAAQIPAFLHAHAAPLAAGH